MRSTLWRPLVGCALGFLLWAGLAGQGSLLAPSPAEVVGSLVDLGLHGPLAEDALTSIWRVSAGVFVAAAAVATLLTVAALWPPFADYLQGPIEVIRPVPPIAWVPLAILMFGIGQDAAIAIVCLGAFFPLWLSALGGLRQVRRSHTLAARSLGAGPGLLLSDVILPSLAPTFLHGLRLAIGLGWFSVVAAEMMGVSSGLGHGIQLFSLNLEIDKLYAYILAVGVIGFTLNLGMTAMERSVGHWQAAGAYIRD